ncbi:hypothetical protein Y887_02270 [Xanthomonas pisi DSM 18956]|uniref:Uncharacterized protein n=2 Tax=Xanthomonas TaxID=338 RepID=A0A2S7D4T6_9XANT|nr:hypothetical protein Y887_02270 [Xanthomonas pisi DSM 18956]PPU68830.1 hypothetical protein XpiCFBP4643_07440 [Xanthomonas pisi]
MEIDPDARRTLGTALTDIIGSPRQSAKQLDEIFRQSSQEAEGLVDAIRQMSVGDTTGTSGWAGNRHWKRVTQSARTAAPFVSDEFGRLILTGKPRHSEGFLSFGITEEGLKALEGRRFLCDRLSNCLTVDLYKPLLQWVESLSATEATAVCDTSSPYTKVAAQEMAGDSELGVSLYWIDAAFQLILDHFVREWRDGNDADDSRAPPPGALESIAEESSYRVKRLIDMAAQEGCDVAKEDSLSLRFAVAVSANRAMAELWGRCDAELKALSDAETLFERLRQANIVEVPDQFLEESADCELDQQLTAWLTNQLGPAGGLVSIGEGLRPMSYADVTTAVKLSRKLQHDYVCKQSKGERGKHAKRQYGGAGVRFVFLLALLAAYGFKTRVSQEFTGAKNSTKAVFPHRDPAKDENDLELSMHAATSIERMVALIHRSAGDGWAFDLRALREQAEAKVRRLEHQANLYKYVVDGRTAPEIFGIYKFLVRLRFGSPRLATECTTDNSSTQNP